MSFSALPPPLIQIIALHVGAPQTFGRINKFCKSLNEVTYKMLVQRYSQDDYLVSHIFRDTEQQDPLSAQKRVQLIYEWVMRKTQAAGIILDINKALYRYDQLNPQRLSSLVKEAKANKTYSSDNMFFCIEY